MLRQLAISVVTSGIAVLLLVLFWRPAPRDAGAASPLGELAQFAPKGEWATPPLYPGSERTLEAMKKPIPLVEWKNVSLSEAIQQFGKMAGVNVHALWHRIEDTGVTQQTPVSLDLRRASAAEVLRSLLRQVDRRDDLLDYYVEYGVVNVTTRMHVDSRRTERVYDVKDLIAYAATFRRAVAAVEPPRNPGVPPPAPTPYISGRWLSGTGIEADVVESMTRSIVRSVEPSCWPENGGQSTMCYWSGRLIVTAPIRVHEKLERLLQDLRETSK